MKITEVVDFLNNISSYPKMFEYTVYVNRPGLEMNFIEINLKLNCEYDFQYSFLISKFDSMDKFVERVFKVMDVLIINHSKFCPIWNRNKTIHLHLRRLHSWSE